MADASYVQTDFRGGLWSETAQGRSNLEVYKTALNECLNSYPMEEGAWTRRMGFRRINNTRNGVKGGRLLPFRFGKSQAYQAELTPGKLRLVAGLTHVRDESDASGKQRVITINKATPAKVRVPDLNWSDGDTVMFDITSDPPQSYKLYNRQFLIDDVNTSKNTFTLYDPVTGDPIDGASIGWINLGQVDEVKRLLEFNTPYTADDLPNVRIVQDTDTNVLFLCPGKRPYSLVVNGVTQFTFGETEFIDGPYLDENELVTTFALSGTSGTVTVTASGTAGVNEGDGFQSTDVDRLIWFQAGPQAWSNAVPYGKEAKVLGSDNNIYKSLVSNNLANDPTTDTGTKWEITADTVVITWLKIVTVVDTTHVTAEIMGDTPSSGTATIHWRLGVYSDTTGWPTCGAYHEARLWLAGAIKNRLDASRNFKSLTFSPTENEGSVSDSNALSGILNNKDSETITWMVSTEDGLAVGTLAGEWLVRASAMDDPVSPTTLQARNPTTAGSADIEAVQAYGSPVFVQASGRKAMTFRRNYQNKFECVNNSEKASGLTSPMVKELVWCQEPMLSLFCRLSDGKLIGATHKVSVLEEQFTGWHRHTHGMERTFSALSAGPSFDGTSDCIYVITSHPTDPDAPDWIEVSMPGVSTGDPTWKAWHVDGSSPAGYIRRMISANGDSFDGIRVYGFEHLEGVTLHPFVGGLDLGDVVITNGYMDLPYGIVSGFTLAFLESLDDGTDYGDWGIQLRWQDAPITTNPLQPLNSILVIDNEITPTASGGYGLWDRDNEVFYRYETGGACNIRVFNALTGDLLREATNYTAIFPNNDAEGILTTYTNITLIPPDLEHEAGSSSVMIIFKAAGDSSFILGLIDNMTLQKWGEIKADVQPGTDTHAPQNIMGFSLLYPDINTLTIQNSNFLMVSKGGNNGRCAMYGASSSGPIGVLFGVGGIMGEFTNTGGSDYDTKFFRMYELLGVTTFGSIAPLGNISSTSFGGAHTAVINEWTVGGIAPDLSIGLGVFFDNTFNVAATTIDPAWTTGFSECTMTYIAYDDTLLMACTGLINTGRRMVKLSREGDIIWNEVMPAGIPGPPGQGDGPWNNHRWGWLAVDGVIYELNLDTGEVTTFTGQDTGFNFIITSQMFYDEVGPSILDYGNFTSIGAGADPPPNYIGTWANDHNFWTDPNWFRVWMGTSYTQDQVHRELNAEYIFSPTAFGVSYISRGQSLPPDYGLDAGAQNGPAFGKKRRNHWYAAKLFRAQNLWIGTDFERLKPVKLTTDGNKPIVAPALFSGVASDTLTDNYSFAGGIAWECRRQYSCTITAMGGFIETQDK